MIFAVGDIDQLVTYVVLYDAHHRVLQFVVNHNVLEFNHAHHASLTLLLNVIAHLKYIFQPVDHVNHALIYAVFTTGNVLSNLYVPLRVDEFHAKSVAHRYNICSQSVLFVNHDQFPYTVPFQQSLLSHLYLAVHKFVSVCVILIDIFAFFHVADAFVQLIHGLIVSYIIGAALYALDTLAKLS